MIFGIIEALALMPVAAVNMVFLAEVGAGLGQGTAASLPPAARRTALLVPAHNEQAIIRRCLDATRAAVAAGTRILVVAHNCTDATAGEAMAAGVEVAPLDRPDERGKGYALAYGRERLETSPPDVVVVLDADCIPEPGAIERLADTAQRHGCAVQAAYLFRNEATDPPVVQISNFAVVVKNLVRQRGCARLGASPFLVGSGMAFPWPLFAALPLATGDLVEDLALSIDLVRAGRAIRFENQARIWSTPGTLDGTRTQRARWEAGYIGTAWRLGPGLVRDGLRGRWGALWTALHIAVPPLTMLVATNILTVGLLTIAVPMGGSLSIAVTAAVLASALFLAVAAAWITEGRSVLSGRALARLPTYLAWKIALYAGLARRRERASWIRTERTG